MTIDKSVVADPYEAPVSGTPGETTLKNFLATALEPVGTTLYIYGGAWDWQDEGRGYKQQLSGCPKAESISSKYRMAPIATKTAVMLPIAAIPTMPGTSIITRALTVQVM